MDSIAILPSALLLKFRSVADPDVRRGLMASTFGDIDAASLAGFLVHLVRRLPSESALYRDVLLVVFGPPGLPLQTRRAVYGRLEADPLRPVLAFLSEAASRPPAASAESPYELEELPIGVRKSRARGLALDPLRRLLADPDPEVIRILLDNPLATEDDALRLASRRPQTAGTFLVILSSSRFGVREPVQAALALNPFCPVRLAVAVTPLLLKPHLVEVSAAPGLDGRVRESAQALLKELHV